MDFPIRRPRRLRQDQRVRSLVRETAIEPRQLILPLFIEEGLTAPAPIAAMPGQQRWPVTHIDQPVAEALAVGVRAFLLFGIPTEKDRVGSGAWDPDGPVCQAITVLKKRQPQAYLITDVCLCEYTDHGHCGLPDDAGGIDNDASLPLLTQMAIAHARAGADMVAPSDMMDGRVGAIRAGLDLEGLSNVPILAYAAKFASCFYGPFREAAQSTPAFGDRSSYQLDPANGREALHEMMLDWEEGADLLMVKPAMPYLDVLTRARELFSAPLVAYQVSGEYSMILAAAERNWIDRRRAILESLTSIRRAGADLIISYFAVEAARYLAENQPGAKPS